jgi:hypothetical protein
MVNIDIFIIFIVENQQIKFIKIHYAYQGQNY